MNPSAGYSPVSNSIPAARLSQVEDQTKQLHAAIETHLGALSNFCERLSPVITPCAPAASNKLDAPKEMLVPVANDFRIATEQVQKATAIICDLLQRLELP